MINNNIPDYLSLRNGYGDFLLESFLRYVRVDTTSDENASPEKRPSTEGQWVLLKILLKEITGMGIQDVSLDDNGYLIARLPPIGCKETLGLIAHVDTSDDVSGHNVNPQIHHKYAGKKIQLKNGITLDPQNIEKLSHYIGEAIITSDGTTLLGADDKAGIATIITVARWITDHLHTFTPRPGIEFIFTPDEETGNGINSFPIKQLQSSCCITVDGGFEGSYEIECFHARKANITFLGNLIHPGYARGKLVNALSMAAYFISMIPRNESPEATDGKYGNYWPHFISGKMERTDVSIMYRSFDETDIDRRTGALQNFCRAVEAAFPGGKVDMKVTELYRNMKEELDKYPRLIKLLPEAIQACGLSPTNKPIRGGTDGARLTAMGMPTPNIFSGAMNIHSLSEWVALPAMLRSAQVILKILSLWPE